jgi:nucleoside-diphosphate-sugar epimerase
VDINGREAPVLVTGGAGFIGSHLVEELLGLGFRVRVLDNFSTGKRANLEAVLEALPDACARLEVREGDICNYEAVLRAMDGVYYVFHEAALGSVPRSVADPVTAQRVNADGTLNVFLAARDCGVHRVVYASSSAVYGDSPKLPRKEGEEGRPLSPYALTKRVNEEYARLFFELYGLDAIGLRYFNVYGPRQDFNSDYAAVIPRFVTALLTENEPVIYGTGEQSRDFTYVKDVVEANLKAMEAPDAAAGFVCNVGFGRRASLLELLEALYELLGLRVIPRHEPARAGDVLHAFADCSLAQAVLGFKGRYDLRTGLKEGIDWYRNHLFH